MEKVNYVSGRFGGSKTKMASCLVGKNPVFLRPKGSDYLNPFKG